MAGQNKVTLTIAGDASGLEKAAAQSSRAMAGTAHSAGDLEKQLEETGRAARGTKELLRGAGDAASLFGGELGNTAIQAGFAVGAVKDLSRGSAALAKSLGVVRIATGGLALGIAALGAGIAAHIDHTNVMNEVNRTAADTVDTVTGSVQFLTQGIPFLNSAMDKARGVTRGWSDDAHGLGENALFAADALKRLAAAHEASLFQAPDQNPGGDAIFTTADAQEIAIETYREATPGYKERTLAESGLFDTKKSIGGGVRSAANDAAQAAKEAAQKLADAKKTVEQAVLGLAKAFTPQLSLDPASGGFSRLGTTQGGSGGGLIGNLRKQAKDTLRLRQDLEKLAKMGLDKGLLTQLVDGGLASLPAAEDLLQGGRAEVSQANYYAGKINTRANTIAAEQTARNLTKKDRQQLDINVKGGSAELVALLRKWVAGNGGNVQGVLGS